ncbi:MAG: septum formation inhibitor Maf [Deltaproteobacteria bacterium]|nr:septum formation inhibitor Maf [Deltaproteobacteria bacterium]
MLSTRRALVLASASPRRRELLERVGVAIEVVATSVDESVQEGEAADQYLDRVVLAKFESARARVGVDRVVLVADTSVLRDATILGKPENHAHALEMLATLSGRRHVVATRFGLGRGDVFEAATVETVVEFRSLSRHEMTTYVATGEGKDKAGGYGIQGRAAAFVRRIEGSYTNVVGLPLAEVIEALERFDFG